MGGPDPEAGITPSTLPADSSTERPAVGHAKSATIPQVHESGVATDHDDTSSALVEGNRATLAPHAFHDGESLEPRPVPSPTALDPRPLVAPVKMETKNEPLLVFFKQQEILVNRQKPTLHQTAIPTESTGDRRCSCLPAC